MTRLSHRFRRQVKRGARIFRFRSGVFRQIPVAMACRTL